MALAALTEDADERSRGLNSPVPHGVLARLAAALDDERHRFFLWAPVALGLGIGGYFALLFEPGALLVMAPLAAAVILKVMLRSGSLSGVAALGLVLIALGAAAAKLRVEYVRAPVLQKSQRFVDVTGTVERAETKAPRGQRLTIVVEDLGKLTADVRPQRVRIRTLKDGPGAKPGDRVTLKATLSAPAKPAVPGGFDFARSAWFEGLGAVGYSMSAPQILSSGERAGAASALTIAIESVRRVINARITAALPGETGAIATALITGERGGITAATNAAYKNSGLFHILSISGLHMVVMAGAVFYAVRLLLACVPYLALNFPIKKWAAAAGISGTLGYLAISGGSFATVRSAVMILIMFAAMLLERPALALRNVALAAFGILLVYPESLFDAGFQMSFAAVTALIATYEEIRRRYKRRNEPHTVLKVLMFFGGILFTTLIASISVAPFAAYQFHQSQQYAMIANLIAIPICNIIVMPSALLALVLMPFGLEIAGLWPMGLGIQGMGWVANKVAVLPGAVGYVPAMPAAAFLLMLAGGLWLALWQARWRLAGLGLAAAGIALAPFQPRPDILIARSGELVAVRGADGRLAALPARQAKYELERWLEHDGDARKAADAGRADGFTCDPSGCVTHVKGQTVSIARHPSALADDCVRARILVLNVPRPKGCDGPAAVVDVFDIYDRGTHALYIEEGAEEGAAGLPGGPKGAGPHIRIDTVAAHRGERPWAHVPEFKPKVPKLQRSVTHTSGSGDSGFSPGAALDGAAPSGAEQEADAPSRPRLPAYAGRPEWLTNGAPRAEVEDDDAEGEAANPVQSAARTQEPRTHELRAQEQRAQEPRTQEPRGERASDAELRDLDAEAAGTSE